MTDRLAISGLFQVKVFSEKEISLLEKGLKYNPINSVNNASLQDLAITVEAIENSVITKTLCAEKLKKKKNVIPNNEQRLAKSLRKKFKEEDLVDLKADKGFT